MLQILALCCNSGQGSKIWNFVSREHLEGLIKKRVTFWMWAQVNPPARHFNLISYSATVRADRSSARSYPLLMFCSFNPRTSPSCGAAPRQQNSSVLPPSPGLWDLSSVWLCGCFSIVSATCFPWTWTPSTLLPLCEHIAASSVYLTFCIHLLPPFALMSQGLQPAYAGTICGTIHTNSVSMLPCKPKRVSYRFRF